MFTRLTIIGFLCCLSFEITAQDDCLPNQSFTIVVLGSSTAAGSGATRSDSAWVNRYRHYLQSLNPDNEVINLAQGGYNSYRLMPDDFTPPAGRPSPDPARNISKAISLNPDGIIINLPSNDVAAGYGLEQLVNFDTMVARAQRADIPIWIATTQPRNFTNQFLIQLQIIVRDSIHIKYGDFAIDFWTLLANENNWIKPYYSAGDGVHLSDAGHKILFRQVVEKRLPYYLINEAVATDYYIKNIRPTDEVLCHDGPHNYEVVISNLGKASSSPIQLEMVSNIKGYEGGGRPRVKQYNFDGLLTCATDTFQITFQANDRHNHFQLSLQSSDDTFPRNDSLEFEFTAYPAPEIFPQGKQPVCFENRITLRAESKEGDPIFWYDNFRASQPVGTGQSYEVDDTNLVDTVWVETLRNSFVGKRTLRTPTTVNKDWNGEMVDLVAKQDLTLQAVNIPIASTGEQSISVYFKNGSRDSFSNDPGAWTFLKENTLQVNTSGAWMPVSLDDFPMSAGDSVSFYFYLNDAASSLNYLDNGGAVVFENDELLLRNGAGIGHTFGTIYYPRSFVGSFEYSYSFTHAAGCRSKRLPVPLDVRMPEIDADPLYLLCDPDSLTLESTPFGEGEVIWYHYDEEFTEVGRGSNLNTGIIETTDTFFVQNQYEWSPDTNYLEVSSIWNTSANGFVFDLTRFEYAGVQSINIRPAQSGAQDILLYQKPGSGLGLWTDEAAWGAPLRFSVDVGTPGELVSIPINADYSSDTMAVYVRMADTMHHIYMHPVDRPIAHVPLKVSYLGAMASPFGGYQPNLAFAGNITYEHLRYPEKCTSNLLPVSVLVSDTELEIGPDTVYLIEDRLVLHASGAFDDYFWSDGSIADSLVLLRSELDAGFTLFTLDAIDAYGCVRTDSVWVYNDRSAVRNLQNEDNCKVYPNPGNAFLQIQLKTAQSSPFSLEIFDVTGRLIQNITTYENEKLATTALPEGMYFLKISTESEYFLKRWIKKGVD